MTDSPKETKNFKVRRLYKIPKTFDEQPLVLMRFCDPKDLKGLEVDDRSKDKMSFFAPIPAFSIDDLNNPNLEATEEIETYGYNLFISPFVDTTNMFHKKYGGVQPWILPPLSEGDNGLQDISHMGKQMAVQLLMYAAQFHDPDKPIKKTYEENLEAMSLYNKQNRYKDFIYMSGQKMLSGVFPTKENNWSFRQFIDGEGQYDNQAIFAIVWGKDLHFKLIEQQFTKDRPFFMVTDIPTIKRGDVTTRELGIELVSQAQEQLRDTLLQFIEQAGRITKEKDGKFRPQFIFSPPVFDGKHRKNQTVVQLGADNVMAGRLITMAAECFDDVVIPRFEDPGSNSALESDMTPDALTRAIINQGLGYSQN